MTIERQINFLFFLLLHYFQPFFFFFFFSQQNICLGNSLRLCILTSRFISCTWGTVQREISQFHPAIQACYKKQLAGLVIFDIQLAFFFPWTGNVEHFSLLLLTNDQCSKRASDSLLYSYKRSFNGFVAKLTEEEKERLASK